MSKSFYTSVTRNGNNIFFRGYSNGKRVQRKVKYKPTLYVHSPKPTQFKSLSGSYLGELDFEHMGEAMDFIKRQK